MTKPGKSIKCDQTIVVHRGTRSLEVVDESNPGETYRLSRTKRKGGLILTKDRAGSSGTHGTA